MITGTPAGTVAPLTPAIKVVFCSPYLPRRMALDSPIAPNAPIHILLLPVVRYVPAEYPIAMLLFPVVLLESAPKPLAVLLQPVVLLASALRPLAVFELPVVLR